MNKIYFLILFFCIVRLSSAQKCGNTYCDSLAKEGYNELIHDSDTFRFTVKDGLMEGPYYHSNENKKEIGTYHRNYKTGCWMICSKATKGDFLYNYEQYKKGCQHGNSMVRLNDSIVLMRGELRYDKRVGKWLIADGALSDPRIIDKDNDKRYYREEKYKNGAYTDRYLKIYVADKSTYVIQYLKYFHRERCCFFNHTIARIDYYANGRIEQRMVNHVRRGTGKQKIYNESGKLIEKKKL